MKRLMLYLILAFAALYAAPFGDQGVDPIHRAIPGNRANFLPVSNDDAPVSHWHHVRTGPLNSASVDIDRVRQELDHVLNQRHTTVQNIEKLKNFVSQARAKIAGFKTFVENVKSQIAECRVMERDFEIRGLGASKEAQRQVRECFRDAHRGMQDVNLLVRQANRLFGLIEQASQKAQILTGVVEHRLAPRIRSLRAELEYLQIDVGDIKALLNGGDR